MPTFEVAQAKAFGALGRGQSSRRMEAIAIERPHFLSGYAGVTGGRAIPVAGGVHDGEGRPPGAVGVSGDTSDCDETAGIAGVEAARPIADV